MYYALHGIYFVLAVVLCGLFLHSLYVEVKEHGWVVSPRFVWCASLCLSSFVFWLIQIDPVGALGVYTEEWVDFIGVFDGVLILNSVCAAVYMYLRICYLQFKSDVPLLLTRSWVASSVVASVLVFIFTLTGAITSNYFWIALAVVVITVQEFLIIVSLLRSLHGVIKLLRQIEEQTGINYRAQRRKLEIIRALALVVAGATIVNQIISMNMIGGLSSWGQPFPRVSLEEFSITPFFAGSSALVTHAILYFMLRRPREAAGTTHISIQSNNSNKGQKADRSISDHTPRASEKPADPHHKDNNNNALPLESV